MLTTIRARLASLSDWLGERDYLEDHFTAGDLLMTAVFRQLIPTGVLNDYPTLLAYQARCQARPAFARAFAAQVKTYADNEPA